MRAGAVGELAAVVPSCSVLVRLVEGRLVVGRAQEVQAARGHTANTVPGAAGLRGTCKLSRVEAAFRTLGQLHRDTRR